MFLSQPPATTWMFKLCRTIRLFPPFEGKSSGPLNFFQVNADVIGKGYYADYIRRFQEFRPSHIIYKIPFPNLFSSHLTQIQSPSTWGQHFPPKHHDKHSRPSAEQNVPSKPVILFAKPELMQPH